MKINYLQAELNNLFYTNSDPIEDLNSSICETTTDGDLSTGAWIGALEKLIRNTPKEYAPVIVRQKEILETREHFRLFIESARPFDFFYSDIASLSTNILENGTYQVQSLVPVGEGISGTYFLVDGEKVPQFVIKPFDEEAGCINNPKSFVGVSDSNPIRDYIPLYHSAMREVLAYKIAELIGLSTIVPKTTLAIIQADQFHDYSEQLIPSELERYLEECGPIDREKLCSIQEFVQNSKPLWKAIDELERQGLSDKEIGARFDRDDFEDANILLWTTYDTDAHMANMLVYPKDEKGTLGIKKIDNGLAFPDKNRQLTNHLVYLENGELPLSDAAREKIDNIDVDKLAEQFKIYDLESAIPALRERISFLKKIAKEPGLTIKEINTAMSRIGRNV